MSNNVLCVMYLWIIFTQQVVICPRVCSNTHSCKFNFTFANNTHGFLLYENQRVKKCKCNIRLLLQRTFASDRIDFLSSNNTGY